jgi:hypothetical protein
MLIFLTETLIMNTKRNIQMKNKKNIILSIVFCLLVQGTSCAFASNAYVKTAIRKYKRGNYSGCLQDLKAYTKKHPASSSSATAYYYLAMSYARAGKKDEAISSYKRVLALTSNKVLFNYASKGKRCLETPSKCEYVDSSKPSELDRVVNSSGYMSGSVKSSVEQQRLNALRQQINSGSVSNTQIKRVDPRFRSEVKTEDRIAMADNNGSTEVMSSSASNKKPSNDEIVNALDVLKRAGYSNMIPAGANSIPQDPQQAAKDAEMAQLSAMLGNNNNNSNNNAMNMLPYMMMQQRSGQGQGNEMSKQAMEAMMINSMMSNMSLGASEDNNSNK